MILNLNLELEDWCPTLIKNRYFIRRVYHNGFSLINGIYLYHHSNDDWELFLSHKHLNYEKDREIFLIKDILNKDLGKYNSIEEAKLAADSFIIRINDVIGLL